MARKQQLDEMEAKNPQSKTAVNANAKPGDPMPKLTTGIPDGREEFDRRRRIRPKKKFLKPKRKRTRKRLKK
jgi:hypothetical protein